MKLKILDTVTGIESPVLDTIFDEFWWAEGNGSCDCNRVIFYDEAMDTDIDDSMDNAMRDEHPELEEWQGLCYGEKRFLITWTDDNFYSLDEFNRGYPKELIARWLVH